MKKEESYEEYLAFLSSYYTNNGISIPKSVEEYNATAPPGYKRTSIKTKFNKTIAQILRDINSEYTLQFSRPMIERLLDLNLDIEYYGNIPSTTKEKTLDCKCRSCGYTWITSYASLSVCTIGCPSCAKNASYINKPTELQKIADTKGVKILEPLPTNNNDEIHLQCNTCNTKFSRGLVSFIHRDSVGECRVCNPSKAHKTFINDIEFASEFESECYKLLMDFNPECHAPYKKYIQTSKLYTVDFKIGNWFIEVSNFKTDYKNYFANIETKRELAESNGFNFAFCRSLQEVKNLIQSHLIKI